MINDDEIAPGCGVERREREREREWKGREGKGRRWTWRPRYNRERHYGGFINCHRRVICSAMPSEGMGMGRGTWSIALAYLIAAFIRTVMSRSFNETRSMLPREIAAASVIYGATISTLPPRSTYLKIIRGKFFLSSTTFP